MPLPRGFVRDPSAVLHQRALCCTRPWPAMLGTRGSRRRGYPCNATQDVATSCEVLFPIPCDGVSSALAGGGEGRYLAAAGCILLNLAGYRHNPNSVRPRTSLGSSSEVTP